MRHPENLRGIILMTLAMALFAAEDLFLKLAAQTLPTGEILLITALGGTAFFAALARSRGQSLTRGFLHPAILARNAGEMIGTLAYMTALAAVPLATVSSILQAMPMVAAVGAALFLREAVPLRRWLAIGAGFAGVLMIIQPGMAGFDPLALWVLVSVAGLALRDLAARKIPAKITTEQVTTWGVASIVVLGAAMIPFQGFQTPSAAQGLSLLGSIAFGTAGYWAVTQATRIGDVSVVAPFRYFRLLFALGVGLVFFAEVPDALTLTGAALIILAGLAGVLAERRH